MVEYELIQIIQMASQIATALGVCIAAYYYVLNLRNTKKNMQMTLETRQAQLLMQIYNSFSETEFMHKWNNLIHLIKYESWDEFNQSIDPKTNIQVRNQYQSLLNYFEGIGVLIYEKLLDPKLVANLMSGAIIVFWEKFGSYIIENRKRIGNPYAYDKTEFLYNEIKKLRLDISSQTS